MDNQNMDAYGWLLFMGMHWFWWGSILIFHLYY
jgi:hypothetical protein